MTATRRRPHRRWLPAIAALPLVAVWTSSPGLAADGFADVPPRHWAHPYVQVLDEERVVDVYRVHVLRWLWWEEERRFQPNALARRDAWLTFIARLFGWPPPGAHQGLFTDVPPDHRLESGEPAAGWLEAAGRAGLATGPVLEPAATVVREEAVAALVHALGLEEPARRLDDATVARLLSRFRDGDAVSPPRRQAVALAVRLGLVEGYPDGTLRPAAQLTRAEAAALLARSALVRARPEPARFSPDGDGVDETVAVWLDTLRNRNVAAWAVTFTDAGGQAVWQGGWRAGPPPRDAPALRWDGRSPGGAPLAAGTYHLRARIRDAAGQEWESAPVPVELVVHRLYAWLYPSVVAPGEPVHVSAQTQGAAYQVTAAGEGVFAPLPLTLAPAAPERWQATVRVPAHAGEGSYDVTVRARFPGAERQQRLSYVVRRPLALQAWVVPDPVPAGTAVGVHAATWPEARRVTARFADGTALELRPAGGGWAAARIVPVDHPRGPTWVEVEAHWDGGARRVRIAFRVAEPPWQRVQVRLSD